MTSGRVTILLVTADEVIAKTLEKQLNEYGYATAVALDTGSALVVIQDVSPSLILVDRQQRALERRPAPRRRVLPRRVEQLLRMWGVRRAIAVRRPGPPA